MSDVVSAGTTVPARPDSPSANHRQVPPPSATRQAGLPQAALLLVTSCLSRFESAAPSGSRCSMTGSTPIQ